MTANWPLRLTQQGYLVALIATLLLLVGLFRAINLLTLLGFILLSILLLNLLLVVWQTGGLTASRHIPRPLTVDQPALLDVHLKNPTGRKRHDLVVIDDGPTAPLVGLIPRLAIGEKADLELPWTPTRRGKQALGPVRVTSGYPFGLVEQRSVALPQEEVVVWPALGAIHRGRLARQIQRGQLREARQHTPRPDRTAQQEIYGLRPFRTGDSTRLIHWRTSARRGELMVREYEDIPPESWTIVFDATAHGPRLQLEQALAFTATLCWEWCRRRGERLVLGIAAAESLVLAGQTGTELGEDLLDLLACVQPAEPEASGVLLGLLRREVGRGAGVLLVSGSPSGLADVLRQELRARVREITAGELDHLDGYTPPTNFGEFPS